MTPWLYALRKAMWSGCIASVASTAVLSYFGKRENGSAPAPTNATSHWLWGDRAYSKNRLSVRHTLIGYGIHHASATFWAVFYERWIAGRNPRRSNVPRALSIAALACAVDYTLTPKRLRPGFEKRVSKSALFCVYASFGLALAVRGLFAKS